MTQMDVAFDRRFRLCLEHPTVIRSMQDIVVEFLKYNESSSSSSSSSSPATTKDNLVPEVFVKLDDTNAEAVLAGNKVRKLEYVLYDAVHNLRADVVIACGDYQSNNCRAIVKTP